MQTRVQPQPLHCSNDRYHDAFAYGPLPAWICDADLHVINANEALEHLLGQPRGALVGSRAMDFTHPDEQDMHSAQIASLLAGEHASYTRECRLLRADGEPVWVQVAVRLVRDEGDVPLYFVGQATDITEQHRREERLRHLADHDALTGLLNRRGFHRELRRHISRVQRYGTDGALLVIDLDNFKGYNDAYGHNAGDDLLRAVADALRQRLRKGDLIGRVGGDEFSALLPKVTAGQAEIVAAALVQAVRDLRTASESGVTVSVGVHCFESDTTTSEDTALSSADTAMYAAKHAGRDRHVLDIGLTLPDDM